MLPSAARLPADAPGARGALVRGSGRASFALVGLCSAGCLPDIEQIPGDNILYEHSAALRPCAGTAEAMNDAVPFVATQLAATAPSPMRYSWLVEEDIVSLGGTQKQNGVFLGGMATGLHAWGIEPYLVHEVIHLVAGGRSSAPFFKEGMAVALDGSGGPYVDVPLDDRGRR